MKRLRSGRETGGGNPGAVCGEPGTRPGAARSARSAEGIPGLQAGGGCQWYDRRIESDWGIGDPVRFYDGGTDVVTDTGTVLEYDPPRRLVYTFRPEMDQHGEPVDWAFTRVAFDLEPLEPPEPLEPSEPSEPTDTGRVRLLLVHDRLASPEEAEGWSKGWIPILASLRTFLQGPDPTAPTG